jgi:flagellar protein FlaG
MSPDATGVVARLPGAPPPAAMASGDAEQAPRVQIPSPPRINYDPVKLRENLRLAIDHLNEQLASSGRSLGFSMDSVINYPVVTVRRIDTGEVIRQIPSEAVVKAAHTIETLKGLLYDATS